MALFISSLIDINSKIKILSKFFYKKYLFFKSKFKWSIEYKTLALQVFIFYIYLYQVSSKKIKTFVKNILLQRQCERGEISSAQRICETFIVTGEPVGFCEGHQHYLFFYLLYIIKRPHSKFKVIWIDCNVNEVVRASGVKVDTLVLGTSASCVWVRIPPRLFVFNL